MTDLQFIEILEKWKRDEIGIETVLDAADVYSLADNGAKSLLAGDSEQLQKNAKKMFYNFNIDVEYSGDFEAFYKEYFL